MTARCKAVKPVSSADERLAPYSKSCMAASVADMKEDAAADIRGVRPFSETASTSAPRSNSAISEVVGNIAKSKGVRTPFLHALGSALWSRSF